MGHNILIAGCGGIGLKLALTLSEHNQVFGLKRDTSTLPNAIIGISANVTQPSTLCGAIPSSIDYLVYCLSPGAFNDEAYKTIYVEGLRNMLAEIDRAHIKPKRLFFVSSTSVYHQDNDEWVDEQSDTLPTRFSGQRLLEAEAIASNGKLPATNVRFSGIYGGHRTRLLEQVRHGNANSTSTNYTNRIHEDDCVAILAHLIDQDSNNKPLDTCYIASDSEPVRMSELIEWMSKQMKLEAPSPPGNVPDTKKRRGAGSKRCSNSRLRETGYQFKYPTFREGYQQMMAQVGC